MNNPRIILSVLCFLSLVLGGAYHVIFAGPLIAAEFPPVSFDPDAAPARNISEYNLFKDNKLQTPNDGLIAYDLNTPLFSDYAHKRRFVYLPTGTSAKYDAVEAFEFPVGSLIVKTFSYFNDINDPSQGERILETRLLLHTTSGWKGFAYIWNEDMSDARLAVAGGRIDVSWKHYDGERRDLNYLVPNMNQCAQCHEKTIKFTPIGPAARNLNKDFAYDSGVENQLTHWEKIGILSGAPKDVESAPRLAVWDDPNTGTVAERARAWLDVNCAHCHNPKGPAQMSGLDLRADQEEAFRYGVMKPPIAAGRGSGDFKVGILPGDPDHSILIHRMLSEEPEVMMPILGRRMVHEEGVDLIRQWISEMDAN